MLRFVIAAAALMFSAATPAAAAEVQKYSRAALEQAQHQGRPVLVDVKAWWCPVCASQNRTIKELTASPAYDKLLILELNYDKQKPDWQALGVNKQATLIGYHGPREIGRVQFKTNKELIEGLLKQTVS